MKRNTHLNIYHTMKLYVASSWRNTYYPSVVSALRVTGHDVYDFRNPLNGDPGFHWTDVNPRAMEWTPSEYQEGLHHPKAERQFKNDRGTLIYNVRLGKNVEGGQTRTEASKHKPVFAVLYNYDNESQYRVYHINHQAQMDKARLIESEYPGVPTAEKYLCYVFDEKVTFGSLNIPELISRYRISGHRDGAPIYMKGKELMEYRKI